MDRGLLFDATADNDAPTPGYMLNEIAKSTIANYQANLQLQEFIVSRLTHKSHNVKYKTLVIVKHVCRTGRAEFKMEMARKVDPIKECLQFRGPPDPLRGDEIYKRVRDVAKEALDAIFDSQMPVTTSAVAAANRIQGMGNDYVPEQSNKPSSGGFISSFVSNISNTMRGDGTEVSYAGHPGAAGSLSVPGSAGGGYSGSSNYGGPTAATMTRTGSGAMVGLGNPNFRDARDEKTWLQKASDLASATVSSVYGSSSSGGNTGIGGAAGPGDYSYASNRGPHAVDAMSNSARLRNGLGSTAASYNGGGSPWQGAGGSTSAGTVGTVSGGGGVVPDLPQGPVGMGRVGHATSDGEYERTMIGVLCEPGGLKAVPPEPQLQDFLVKAPTLSPELVGNVLLDVLSADAYQSRIKGLIVIAALVQAKECQGHFDWWVEQLDALRALLSDSKAGVRAQAAKTLRALGEEAEVVSSRTSRSVSPKPHFSGSTASDVYSPGVAPKNDSLLDILDMPAAPAAVTPSAPQQQQHTLSAPPSFYSPAPTSVAPPPPPAAATASVLDSADMFAGMSLVDTPVSASSSFPSHALSPTTAPAPAASTGFDFLSSPVSMSAPAPSMASAAGPVDFFADLTTHVSPAPLATSPAYASTAFPPSATAGRSSANTISSAFVEAPSKPDYRDAFSEWSLSSSGPAQAAAPAPQPMGAYYSTGQAPAPSMGMGMGMGGGGGALMMGSHHHPNSSAMRPGTSVLAPSMISPTAPRKAIPTAESLAANNSGFSFLGGEAPSSRYPPAAAPAGRPSGGDSFGFVTDAMNNMNKK